MEKGLVSIVVPVYKTEKYLDQCVESIVNQTYRNVEILLIDDGSPDRCPKLCDAWAEKDRRIRVIHKQNEGLGMARNTGIENARGEYICFFDSDDYLEPTAIEHVYAAVCERGVDIGVFGFRSVDPNGNEISSFVPEMEKAVYMGDEVQTIFLPELIAPDPRGNGVRKLYMSMCMMLFSRNLISRGDWRVASEREIISEDVYSLLTLFQLVKSVAVVSEPLYNYRVNVNSLSRSYRADRYLRIREFYQACMLLCDRLHYCDEVKLRLTDPFLAFVRGALKQEAAASLPVGNRIKHFKQIIEDDVLQSVLWDQKKDAVGWKSSIFCLLMKHKLSALCFICAYAMVLKQQWDK